MAKHVEFTAAEIETEEWRPVIGWEECGYQVSSIGRVRKVWVFWKTKQPKEKLHKIRIQGTGYTVVTLQHTRERVKFPLVHKLVAEAFIGPRPTPEHQINHKDGDKTNNKWQNLEYVTSRENLMHGREMGLIPRICGIAERSQKLTPDDVREIRRLGLTSREVADRYHVHREYAWRIVTGKSWKWLT